MPICALKINTHHKIYNHWGGMAWYKCHQKFSIVYFNTNMEIDTQKCCFSSKRLDSMCNSKFSTVKHALNECVMSFSYWYNLLTRSSGVHWVWWRITTLLYRHCKFKIGVWQGNHFCLNVLADMNVSYLLCINHGMEANWTPLALVGYLCCWHLGFGSTSAQ